MSACWLWRAPKNNGGAPSSCGRFGDFLLFFMQLRVDDSRSARGDTERHKTTPRPLFLLFANDNSFPISA
jgi:hypothetical protein